MRVVLNTALLLALAAIVVANIFIRPHSARPNYDFLPDMARSARYAAFAPNPNFAGGETLQSPPAGAIPRGMPPLHYANTPQDALRAGEELQAPVDLGSQQARERGAVVFSNFCVVCHGPSGTGNGVVTQRGVPPPPPLVAERAVKMKDGQLFHILTYGQANMPSYASQLSREDRWNVIAHVRTLQAQAKPRPVAPASAPAKVAAGTPVAPAAGGQQ